MVSHMSTITWRRRLDAGLFLKGRDQPIFNSDGIFGCHGE